MKNRKDKSNGGRTNPARPRSTKARTAGGKKLNPEVMASAEQQALGKLLWIVPFNNPALLFDDSKSPCVNQLQELMIR